MKIKMYGTRGSIPTPSDKDFKTSEFGGNTTCVTMETSAGLLIFDAGTGIRRLGHDLFKKAAGNPITAHLFFSHSHNDHVCGLPFFGPAYVKTNSIVVHGEAKKGTTIMTRRDDLVVGGELAGAVQSGREGTTMRRSEAKVREALSSQMDTKQNHFPVPIEALAALSYRGFSQSAEVFRSEDTVVHSRKFQHPVDGVISYRISDIDEQGNRRVVVFCTDFEPVPAQYDSLVQWWSGADLVIADAQYEPLKVKDSLSAFKAGWGHSDWETDITIAQMAGVKKLFLTHHDPMMSDEALEAVEIRAQDFIVSSDSKPFSFGFPVTKLAREQDEYVV